METILKKYEMIKAAMPDIAKSTALANFLQISCLFMPIFLAVISMHVFFSAEYLTHVFFWPPDQLSEMQKVKDLDMGRLFFFAESILVTTPLLISVPFWVIYVFSKKILRRNQYIRTINEFVESNITRELHLNEHQIY